MFREISILRSRIPECLFDKYDLSYLIHSRGDEPEVWFTYHERGSIPNLIPVWHDGQLSLHEWGSRSSKCKLPTTWHYRVEDIEKLKWLSPERVTIPANFVNDNEFWYLVEQGIEGILVRDRDGNPHVYVLDMAATHYYQIMTHDERMPVLIEQVI